ncbi:MAG TPA: hypothetical protein VHE59_07085 [Mucilaginibacter sp.]|nr:hypothetical protein [Mucilaginibacter sp.]
MRNIYFLLLCLFVLTSCSRRLITKNITDKTSSYIVKSGGQKINAQSVSLHGETATADSASYALTDLSAVKIGPGYYGVKNGTLYDGVYYGKLMLLMRYAGSTYDLSTHSTQRHYDYYLQKKGQSDILDLTGKNLVASVSDDPLALRKARASRIYGTVNITSAFTTLAGLGCVFLPYTNPIRKPAVTVGLISLPTFLITLPITSHKRYKSIIVYDRDNP